MAYPQMTFLDSSCYLSNTDAELTMGSETKHSASSTSATDCWPVDRYLMDNNTPFPIYPVTNAATPAIMLFSPSQIRRAVSPPYTNSSTCSRGLSPPAETDSYYNIYSPPTPRDMAFFSQGESYPQAYEYIGLADGCVNPGDINPIQDYSNSYLDNSMLSLGIASPSPCTMLSDESNFNPAVWAAEVFQPPRSLSPDSSESKEDICLQNIPEGRYTEVDEKEIPDAGSPSLKSVIKEEDDCEHEDEHMPNVRSECRSPKSTRNNKRRYTSDSAMIAKRLKTAEKPRSVSLTITPMAQGTKGQHQCPDCLKSFTDQTNLDSHIKKQHTRPFTCIFKFAGCDSTFPSKNEWKRHCASQHIVLQYWVCQLDACAHVSNKTNMPKKQSSAGRRGTGSCRDHTGEHQSTLPNGTIFNRKDLYTQHLRRMHVPTHLKAKIKSKTSVPEWEDQQRVYQEMALRTRCRLPEHMSCPGLNCSVQFEGSNAWDDRMEHVAKHLEKAAAGLEPSVPFGGESDESLVDWAASPAVGILKRGDKGRWVLQSPLKANAYPELLAAEGNEDVDADGEEVDE